MTKKEFDNLDSKSKRKAVQKARAWFCVLGSIRQPFLKSGTYEEEIETIKIILSKYINEELKEKSND